MLPISYAYATDVTKVLKHTHTYTYIYKHTVDKQDVAALTHQSSSPYDKRRNFCAL